MTLVPATSHGSGVTAPVAIANLAAGLAGQFVGGTVPSYLYPPGTEIGYDQIVANVNILATDTVIIAGSSHVFDGAPVICTAYSSGITLPSTSNPNVNLNLFEGSTDLGRLGTYLGVSTVLESVFIPFFAQVRFTPGAGAHTYSLHAIASSATGPPQVTAGAGGAGDKVPTFLRFTKA